MFSVAAEEGRMDEFFEAAKVVAEVLRANEEFGKLMNHPKIMKEDKIKIVEETFATRLPKEMLGLMTLMVEKGRAAEFLPVFDYFVDVVREEKKIGQAHITTAVELDASQKQKIEKRLLDTTKYESFEMYYYIDESLIGGMVIRIGDRVVDSSIKTQLYDLSRELRNIQV